MRIIRIGILCFVLAFVCDLPMCPAQESQAKPKLSSEEIKYSLEARSAMAAHHLCSGLWVTGRSLKRTPEEVLNQDIAPFTCFGWEDDFQYSVDWEQRSVTVQAPGIIPRTAKYHGDQGSTILPRGAKDVYFDPISIPCNLPPASEQSWPMGDKDATFPIPAGVDKSAVGNALDWAMDQKEYNTRSIVIVYRGKIIGERYAEGWTKDTPQIGWSQGKSITAALIGILVNQGHFGIDDFAPVKEWQSQDDPRKNIRIRDLLRMSSGLDFTNLGISGPETFIMKNKHFRVYFDSLNVFDHAVNQPLEIPPNTQWRYRNSDPLTLGKIIKDTVTAKGEEYLTFPQRALFDRIGVRNSVLETDAWGNFILCGYEYVSARDWTRFGLLHLWDGVWEGERILPEGWIDFITTPAPADPKPHYGGLFWLNQNNAMDRIPKDAYWAAGFMGQITLIIPSRDLVVVRLGPSPIDIYKYLNEFTGRVLDSLPSN